MRILAFGFFKLSFFHLLSHALFKALLFLCAGRFIHNIINFQDIRFCGSLFFQMPLSSFCFNISSLALCGMPFLAGFYSKDLILEILLINNMNFFIFFIFFSTGLTVSYSFRLIFFVSINRVLIFSLIILSDKSWLIIKNIIFLRIFSIFGGRILSWLIFPYYSFIFLPFYYKFLTLFVCFLGFFIGYFFFSHNNFFLKYSLKVYLLKRFLSRIWFLPFFSTLFVISDFLKIGEINLKVVDLGWIEYFGSQGIFLLLKGYSNKFINFIENFFFIIFLLFFLFMLILFLYLINNLS